MQGLYNLGYLYFQMGMQNRNDPAQSQGQFEKAATTFRECVAKSETEPKSDAVTALLTDCLFNLGQLHQFGFGCDKDMRTAIRYFKRAC